MSKPGALVLTPTERELIRHEFLPRITVERLVQHLERSRYVLMKRPEAPAPSTPPTTAFPETARCSVMPG